MSWLQVLGLAFTVVSAIISALYAVFRPLVSALIEAKVVEPIKELRGETKRNGEKLRMLEMELSRLRTVLYKQGVDIPERLTSLGVE